MEQASSTIQATSAEIRHTLLSPLALPEWNEARALSFLNIERVAFDHFNGNCQGFADARRAKP